MLLAKIKASHMLEGESTQQKVYILVERSIPVEKKKRKALLIRG